MPKLCMRTQDEELEGFMDLDVCGPRDCRVEGSLGFVVIGSHPISAGTLRMFILRMCLKEHIKSLYEFMITSYKNKIMHIIYENSL